VGAEDRQLLASRRRALDVLAQTLRNPADEEDAFDLSVTTPIEVEAGLLARQTADLDERVDAFLKSYSASKKAGMQTLASAAARLAEIDALKKGKKAALDKVLKGSRKGKHSPKKELAAANALLEEQRAIDEGRAHLETRKAAAVAQVSGELAPFGLSATSGYDALLAALSEQQERVERAATALAELDRRQARAVEITQTLSLDSPANLGGAQTFARGVSGDAGQLAGLAARVQQAQSDYLVTANGLLRKAAADFGGARVALAEVEQGLDQADALRNAAATYVAGFTVFEKKLSSLAAIRTWVKREARKAESLGELAHEAVADLEKAIAKLGRGRTRP
jgi:hypothetical protein